VFPSIYTAFGLNISSEFELRGALPGSGMPDVYIRLGRVRGQLENADATGVCYQAARAQLLLNMQDVARFLISSGNEILIDVIPGGDWDMLLLLLFGSAFGALLHQRGLLVMHASAIGTPRGAVLFTGGSGYGKSTLAGAFLQRGFPVLTDDVCAIDTDRFPIVLPANPCLMLWRDAADRLGLNEPHLRRVRSTLEKYILPLRDAFSVEPYPLHAIYILEPSNSDLFDLVPVRGLQKMKFLSATSYRPNFLEGMHLEGQFIRQLGEVAGKVKVVRVNRPRGAFRVDELADLLATDFAT
jgi:hypothetical protein